MQWQKRTGIPRTTIVRRLKNGWKVEDALSVRPAVEVGSIEYKGETLPLHEWARRLGVKKSTLWARLKLYGFSMEEAISKPIRQYK